MGPIAHGATVIVACSGGPDSTALAVLAAAARPDLRCVLVTVAHGLRTPAHDLADGDVVARLASLLGAEHVVLPVRVVRTGAGLEADARTARHAALEEEAVRRGAAAILLGHHAADQAETVLLRLARGAGVDGIGGMAPVAGLRVRPLLDVRSADAQRAAREFATGPLPEVVIDPMNTDRAFARVRAREEVLPVLARLGTDPVGALTRLAHLARDEAATLDAAAAELAASLPVVAVGPAVVLPSAPLRAAPAALARRVLRAALGTLDAVSIERFLRAPDGWRATLPGPLDASVERGWHLARPAGPVADAPPLDIGPHDVAPDPGGAVDIEHPPSGLRLHASRRAVPPQATSTDPSGGVTTLRVSASLQLPPGLDPARCDVDLDHAGPLVLRTRRHGDRIRTAAGTRTVADVMQEGGVPRALRDLLPVVAERTGRVLWLPGLAVDADAAAQGRRPGRAD